MNMVQTYFLVFNESIFQDEISRFLGFWYLKEDWSSLS